MLRLSTATPMPVGERANSAFVRRFPWRLRCFRPMAAGASAIPEVRPTCSTKHLTHLLRSCKDVRFLLRLHSRLVVLGFFSADFSRCLLLNCYSSFGRCDAALALFNSSPHPTVALWNSMIRCYNRTGEYKKAVQFYHLMLRRGLEPDKYTFTFASKACAGALDSETGDMIRRDVVRRGLLCDVFISTGLVDMYSKLGRVNTARELFESMAELDAVSWNAMIAGFSTNDHPLEALEVFGQFMVSSLGGAFCLLFLMV